MSLIDSILGLIFGYLPKLQRPPPPELVGEGSAINPHNMKKTKTHGH